MGNTNIKEQRDALSNFQRMRIKRGYSQALMAAEVGVKLRTLQHWERVGLNSAAAETVYKFAKALHCLMEDLLDEDEEAILNRPPVAKRGRPSKKTNQGSTE